MLLDTFGRPLRNLRLSVTDRCNLRCEYCMPEESYAWLPRHDLLHFGEIGALVDVFVSLGVDKVRITGGEPLLRRDLWRLIERLSAKPAIKDLAITTNGVLLADQVATLKAAGLHRVTVSLDTLRRDRFVALTRRDALDAVLAGIDVARDAFGALKIDTVVMRGTNDDELLELVEFGRSRHAEVRFIEYMDVGGATRWTPGQVVSRREMLERIEARHGSATPLDNATAAPADRFALADGTVFGIISSTTQPFCAACDRSRLTADGMWYTCLYATDGLDLRAPFRADVPPSELVRLIVARWTARTDRGAERRLALGDRRAFIPVGDLTSPHDQMHTRGG